MRGSLSTATGALAGFAVVALLGANGATTAGVRAAERAYPTGYPYPRPYPVGSPDPRPYPVGYPDPRPYPVGYPYPRPYPRPYPDARASSLIPAALRTGVCAPLIASAGWLEPIGLRACVAPGVGAGR